jgi:signal transduction histidine kinase
MRRHTAAPSLAAVGGAMVVVAAVVSTLDHHPYPLPVWLLLQLPGAAFIGSGVVAWSRRPANGTGRLMVVVGVTWYLGGLQTSEHEALFAVGFVLFHVPFVAFAHMVLALPSGRLTRWDERINIGLQYVATVAVQTIRYLAGEPLLPEGWGDASPGPPVWAAIGNALVLILTVVTGAQILRRWRAAGRLVRHEYSLVWMTIIGCGVAQICVAIGFLAAVTGSTRQALALGFAFALGVTPVTIVIGLLRAGLTRLRVADLVIALDATAPPGRLRDLLAEAVRDPTLEVYFPLPGRRGYVDVDGRSVPYPPGAGRAVTPVARDGSPLAVLVHDPALSEQERLVSAVVATARLALDNARLHAEQRARLEQVRASRARLVVAADEERRRIQRDLHDGVQHKLLATSMLLGRVRRDDEPALLAAADQLREVIADLRDLTRGIYPPALSEQGLAAALEELAERAPLPVVLDVAALRWPEHIERAAYFVVTEALTNAYKHAGASRARAVVRGDGGCLVVEVADDGVGGADPTGAGLRGLEDRVGALGGRLRIDSPIGGGTTVSAELPCV